MERLKTGEARRLGAAQMRAYVESGGTFDAGGADLTEVWYDSFSNRYFANGVEVSKTVANLVMAEARARRGISEQTPPERKWGTEQSLGSRRFIGWRYRPR